MVDFTELFILIFVAFLTFYLLKCCDVSLIIKNVVWGLSRTQDCQHTSQQRESFLRGLHQIIVLVTFRSADHVIDFLSTLHF